MNLSKTQVGELYIYSQSILYALFPIVTILGYSSVTPLYSAAITSFFGALFFAVMITIGKKWGDLKVRKVWPYILIGTLGIGVGAYGLIFIGLKFTSAGNMMLLGLTEILFTYLILGVIVKHEPIIPKQMLGALLMIIGAAIVLLPKAGQPNIGDIIILCAFALPPLANHYQKKSIDVISVEAHMFARTLLAGMILLFLAMIFEPKLPAGSLKESLSFLLINGFIIMGLSKKMWFEGMKRLSVSKSLSLTAINPILTMFLAWIILREEPTIWQILAFIPIFTGVIIITDFMKKGEPKPSLE